MREKLGESLASVQKYDVPLEHATTPSLEALKAYSMGLKTWWAKGETAGLPLLKRAVELDPNFAMAYARMGVMYGNLFQLDLSSENTRKAYELRERTSERERLFQKEVVEAYHGQLRRARETMCGLLNSAKHHDSLTIPALGQAALGLVEAYFGDAQQARADANEALRRAAPKDFPRWIAALALATSGDSKAAAKLVEELDKSLPLDTAFQHYFAPAIRSAIAMDNRNPNKAIELLQVASPYDLGTMGSMDPVYLRGQAYLELGNGSAAAGEFLKIIEHPGIAQTWPPGPGALPYLGLARAYVLQEDTAKARAAYQDFLTLWKDADPDIPILKQAKAEYSKLKLLVR
jgi:eukaryotic-like serine/threonine-protein kinase